MKHDEARRAQGWARGLAVGLIFSLMACGSPSTPSTPDGQGGERDNQAEAVAPEPWGEVEAVAGDGSLELCLDGCQGAAPGAALTLGASLQTDAAARSTVRLGDGSRLRLDAEARVLLLDRGRLRVEKGEVVLEAQGEVTLETPAATITARPGTTHLRLDDEGARVGVLSGDAQIQAGDRQVSLAAGESARVDARGVTMMPGANLAYQTAWARDMTVEVEQSESSEQAPAGVGTIMGRDPATRRELPEAIELPGLDVHVTVREQIARTEITQTFLNTTGRTLEGIYTFPLPPDASIVRFAMEVNGEVVEGEIVEKGRAQRIFNSVVADYMRPKDPALLEWKGGNTFQIRIFPIFPKARQKVYLWYTQTIPGGAEGRRYTYPLPRTGKVGIDRFSFSADVETGGAIERLRTPMYAASIDAGPEGRKAQVAFSKENFHPRQDMVMEWSAPRTELQEAFVGADREAGQDPYFMMVLRPSLEIMIEGQRKPREAGVGARDHVFVVDTSYGTAEGDLKAASAAVASWLATLGPEDRFTVLAADQDVRPWRPGMTSVSSDSVQEAMAFLERQTPGGASDLEGALTAAASKVERDRPTTVIYIGDGRPTLGETRREPLIDRLDAALGASRATVHAVGIGANVDAAMLRVLTRRLGGVLVTLNRGEDVPRRVADMAIRARRPALRQATVAFSSDKIDLVYPTHLPTLFAGDEVVVVGRFRGRVDGQVTLTGLVGDEPFAQPFRVELDQAQAAPRSFLPRLWAQQHIEHLTLFGGPGSEAQIIAASQRYTVMSRLTTFLVLENERMFARYKVERDRNRQYWEAGEEKEKAEKAKEGRIDDASDKDGELADRGEGEEDPRDELSPLESEATASPSREQQAQAAAEDLRRGGDAFGDDDAVAQEPGLLEKAADANEGSTQDILGGVDGALGAERETRLRGGETRDLDNNIGLDGLGMGKGSISSRDDSKVAGNTGAGPRAASKPREAAPAAKPSRSNLDGNWANEDPAPDVGGVAAEPKKAARRAPAAGAKGRGKNDIDDLLGGGGGGFRTPTRRVYRPRPQAQIRSLAAEPTPAPEAQLAGMRQRIESEPLRRDFRRTLVNHHMRRGEATEALRALEGWVQKDPDHALAHWLMADTLARLGRQEEAQRRFGNAVELASADATLLRRWATSLLLRGERQLAAAAFRALHGLTGQADHALDMIAVEALSDPVRAQEHLAGLRVQVTLDDAQRRRADGLAAVMTSGRGDPLEGMPGAERDLRGAAVVSLSWEGSADLDLSVILPYGERVSADMPLSSRGDGKRGRVARVANRGLAPGATDTELEALVLPWAPVGSYLFEIVRQGDLSSPVEATVKVRALGTTRTFRVTIPAGERDVRAAAMTVVMR